MQMSKFLFSMVFLLVVSTVVRADSITLNVTSWQFNWEAFYGNLGFSIKGVDTNGNNVTLGLNPVTNYSPRIRNRGDGTTYLDDATYLFNNNPTFLTGIANLSTTNGTPLSIYSTTGLLYMGTNSNVGNLNRIDFGATLSGTLSFNVFVNGDLTPNLVSASFSNFIGTGGVGLSNGNTTDLSRMTVTGNSGQITLNGIPPTAPVPEPTTLLLLGSGMTAFAVKKRRRKQ
jgi:PEP-CTERM motif